MSGDVGFSLGDLLHVETNRHGTEATIIVEGEFDMTGVEPFLACVNDALDAHPESIAVDARGLTFIDSSGLATLLRARTTTDEAGVHFRISEPSPTLRRVAELGGVEDLLADE